MTTPRSPLAGRVAGPLRSGVLWGILALLATGLLAGLIGGGASAATWVMERFGAAEFGWPGELVFGVSSVGVALSVPAATWAVSYASTQQAPAGRALVATGLGVGALVAIAAVDRSVALLGGAAMAFAVALPFGPWHRLTLRLVPLVVTILAGVAFIDLSGNVAAIIVTAVAYPVGAAVVWLGDALWRWLPLAGSGTAGR